MTSRNWSIIGQERAIRFFDKLLDYEEIHPGTLGGTFILAGSDSLGKTTALESFLDKLIGTNNADIAELELLPDNKEIGVGQVREFSGRIALSSFGGHYRIGVVRSAETLSLEAANALLKTLEDARDQVIIFLLTTAPDLLPATVRSRSQTITFSSVSSTVLYDWLIESIGVTRPHAKNFSRLAGGRPGIAWSLAKDKKLLEERLLPVRTFCQAVSISLPERWQLVHKLLGTIKGTEASTKTKQIILSWRLGIRDAIMLSLNRPELVTFTILEEELRQVLRRLSLADLRRFDVSLTESLKYLEANVSSKLVLEQAFMNIS